MEGSALAAPLWSAMAWLPGGLAELRWGALVALFVAALATLAVYLVQYALLALRRGRPAPAPAAPAAPARRDELLEEGGSVLAWALSRGSWRRQWRRAWVAALRAEAAERAVSAGMQVMDGWKEGRDGECPVRFHRARRDGAGASRPWGIAPGRGSGRSPLRGICRVCSYPSVCVFVYLHVCVRRLLGRDLQEGAGQRHGVGEG